MSKALREFQAAVSGKEAEEKALSLLKLDLARAKDAASDLWSTTSGTPARDEREKVYHQISKLEAQVSKWKATRS